MEFLIGLFLVISVSACATRKHSGQFPQTKTPTAQKSEAGTPIVDTPTPPVPKSTQGSVASERFLQAVFKDVNGFDEPLLTVAIPSDSAAARIDADDFKVEFEVCPTNPDPNLPPELKTCMTGFKRGLQFAVPVFAEEISVSVRLCDEGQCYDGVSLNLKSKRFLKSSSGAGNIQLASLMVKQELLEQDTLVTIGKLRSKLQDLVKFINTCKPNLSSDQISTIVSLSEKSRKELEVLFLTADLSTYQGLLSQDFTSQANATLKKTRGGIDDLLVLFDNAVLLGGVAVTVVGTVESLKSWNFNSDGIDEWKKQNMIINENGKIVELMVDDETGFLVEKGCTDACKHYIQDPQTRMVAKNNGRYIDIDPKTYQGGIKMRDNLYYKYDYAQKAYASTEKAYVFDVHEGELAFREGTQKDLAHARFPKKSKAAKMAGGLAEIKNKRALLVTAIAAMTSLGALAVDAEDLTEDDNDPGQKRLGLNEQTQCNTGPSLGAEIKAIGTNRTNMAVMNVQIVDTLRLPVTSGS